VFAASEGTFGGKPLAFFDLFRDLFRVDNGKIAEHWDVMADIPAEMTRRNEKFYCAGTPMVGAVFSFSR
jgi:predicted SnoaL-like aldol condensation-catalyzing enzyme